MDCAKLREDISKLTTAKNELEEYGYQLFWQFQGELSDLVARETTIDSMQDDILRSHLAEFAEKNQIIEGYDARELSSDFGAARGDAVPLADGRLAFYDDYDVRIVNKDESKVFEFGDVICDVSGVNDVKALSNGDLFVKRADEDFYVLCEQEDGSFNAEKLNPEDYFTGDYCAEALPSGDILMCGESEAAEDSVVLFKKREDGFGAINGHQYEFAGMAALYERNQSDMKDIRSIIGLSNGDVVLGDKNGKIGILRMIDESGHIEFEFERQEVFEWGGLSEVRYLNESLSGYVTLGDGAGRFITVCRGSEGEYESAGEGNISATIQSFTPLPDGDSLMQDYNGHWHLYGRKHDGDYGFVRQRLKDAFDAHSGGTRVNVVEQLPDETLLASCSDGEIRRVTYDFEDDTYGVGDSLAHVDWEVEDIVGLPDGNVLVRGDEDCIVLRHKTNATLEDLKRKLPDIAAKRF